MRKSQYKFRYKRNLIRKHATIFFGNLLVIDF